VKVLVTGGAGFIGSHIVAALIADGRHEVRVLDNFATGRHENLLQVGGDVELIEGDIRGLETVERAVAGVDVVLHQAALPSVARSIEDPSVSTEVNLGGTINVLIAAHKADVRRVVLASSSSVYGDSDELPKRETMMPCPKSPYAVSKLASEHFCRVFSGVHELDTLCLRYFNVFGPRQDPTSQYSGVIARFITSALAGTPLTVYGDGTQTRDFGYVDNIVRANLLALASPTTFRGEVANIACGVRVSLLDLIGHLDRLLGHSTETRFFAPRVGDVAHSQAALDEARRLIGYEPVCDFETGLAATLDWYRETARRD